MHISLSHAAEFEVFLKEFMPLWIKLDAMHYGSVDLVKHKVYVDGENDHIFVHVYIYNLGSSKQ